MISWLRKRMERSTGGDPPSPTDFEGILKGVLAQDDGLVLRVGAYERMLGERSEARGWSERLAGLLRRRSRKIFGSDARIARTSEE